MPERESRLLLGDCIERMRRGTAESIDAIVTDPPYGLGFMGKKWDDLPPGEEWAEECLRVLKPGGHLLAFGGTRTYHRLACALEDAGFEIRDCLAWMYGQGFPKSLDVSKAIDKTQGVEGTLGGPKTAAHAGWIDRGRMRGDDGHEGYQRSWMADEEAVNKNAREYIPGSEDARRWQGWGTALKPAFEPIVLARKLFVGTVAANVLTWGTGSINVDGCRIRGSEEGPGDSVPGVGGEASARECPVHGLRGVRKADEALALGDTSREAPDGVQPSVSVEGHDPRRESAVDGGHLDRQEERISAHEDGLPLGRGSGALADADAARGLGASTGYGAASRSLADTARTRPPLKRGQAGQPVGELDSHGLVEPQPGAPSGAATSGDPRRGEPGAARCTCRMLGRWPANVLLDEEAAALLDEQTGELHSQDPATRRSRSKAVGVTEMGTGRSIEYADKGGASRFFYVAKASKRERNAGLPEGMTCTHPTVKPIALMRWLVRLVTPPGGRVLDPFMGSGTTGIACALEGFGFVGIEVDPEYLEIARARIEHWKDHEDA